MKLIFICIVLIYFNIASLNCEAIDIARDFSELIDEVKLVLEHPTFRLLNQKTQYKLLKAMFGLVENFTKKSNSIVDIQLFGVGDIPTCRFC